MHRSKKKLIKSDSSKIDIQKQFNSALESQKRGDSGVAKSIYLKILSQMPNHFDSLHMLALILSQSGELQEAEQFFAKAIRINSKFAPVYSNQGNLLKSLGRLTEALASFDHAVKLNPNYAIAHLNRGIVLQEMSRTIDALTSFDNAIRINPAMKEAYNNRGVIFLGLGKLDEAIANFDEAIHLKPNDVSAIFNKGNAFKEKKLFFEALTSYDEVFFLYPQHFKAYTNRGMVLQELGRPHDAIASYTKAIEINGDFAEAYSNRGNAFKQIVEYDAALADYSAAIGIKPDYADAIYNRSVLNLLQGNYAAGWAEYEWRSRVSVVYRDSLLGHADITTEFLVRNSRSDFNGKTVFVASEQGVGDHIMFMSMLPELLQDSGSVICQLDPRLLKLFSRCFPLVRFVPRGDVSILETVDVDSHIRMGSLGYTYRRDISSFPGTPYLIPDPERVAQWKERISLEPGKLRVGISWRGGSSTTNGADRSMALEQLTSLLDREDCTFISLQYGEVEVEVAAFNEGRSRKLFCFEKKEIEDFEDFAGLIGALDCVISVQNTTVHTCGALGKPCFAMLPFRPEWRYGASGDTMPWYKSVKLFRQIHDGQWSDVIEHISERLNVFKIQNISK